MIFCYKLILSEHKWYSVTSWYWVSTSDILLQADVEWAQVIFCYKLMLLCVRSDILSQVDVAVSQKWYSVTSWWCWMSTSDVLSQADVAVSQKWYSVTSWCCCVSEVMFCHKLMLLCIRSDVLLQADVAVSQKYCCFFAAEPCSSVCWPQPWWYFGTEPPALRTGQYCPLLVQQQKISHDF